MMMLLSDYGAHIAVAARLESEGERRHFEGKMWELSNRLCKMEGRHNFCVLIDRNLGVQIREVAQVARAYFALQYRAVDVE